MFLLAISAWQIIIKPLFLRHLLNCWHLILLQEVKSRKCFYKLLISEGSFCIPRDCRRQSLKNVFRFCLSPNSDFRLNDSFQLGFNGETRNINNVPLFYINFLRFSNDFKGIEVDWFAWIHWILETKFGDASSVS